MESAEPSVRRPPMRSGTQRPLARTRRNLQRTQAALCFPLWFVTLGILCCALATLLPPPRRRRRAAYGYGGNGAPHTYGNVWNGCVINRRATFTTPPPPCPARFPTVRLRWRFFIPRCVPWPSSPMRCLNMSFALRFILLIFTLSILPSWLVRWTCVGLPLPLLVRLLLPYADWAASVTLPIGQTVSKAEVRIEKPGGGAVGSSTLAGLEPQPKTK